MKLALISDLHMDRNNQRMGQHFNYARILAEHVRYRQVDLVLLAGDISNDYQLSQDFLKALQDYSSIPALFVAGNHEYWQEPDSSIQARDIFDFYLQQDENLVGRPYHLNDEWVVCGSPSWYDYGYANQQRFSLKELGRKTYRYLRWNDRRFVDWQAEDLTVSQWMKDQLKKDLESVKDKKIILMTHLASHPRFVVPLPHRIYDYVNAYLGAQSYESLWQNYPVYYNLMGHVHWRQHLIDQGVHHLMACLGHRKNWLNPTDPYTEIDNTLMIFQL